MGAIWPALHTKSGRTDPQDAIWCEVLLVFPLMGVTGNNYTKIFHRMYWDGTPTPTQLAQELSKHGLAITGISLWQLYNGTLQFPIHVATERQLKSTQWVTFHRRKQLRCCPAGVFSVEYPVLAITGLSDAQAIETLEGAYAKAQGAKFATEHTRQYVPQRNRELLRRAVVGMDSPPEKLLITALREQGIDCHANVLVGDYRWDIQLDRHRVLIDVDGFEFHRFKPENQDAFVRDRWKTNDATLRGYLCLRYAARSVYRHTAVIVDQVQAAIRIAPHRSYPFDASAMWHRGCWKWS
ncbi:hypothetical protein CIP107580_02002 [Corynebacterium diphtheriae]|nr:hypothetical protein CIP107533_02025 [Corynebacterium diphtheriae]CAB0664870.1 hypothetical protein CIP107580_02002 [Corynebacterium diphtheriae]